MAEKKKNTSQGTGKRATAKTNAAKTRKDNGNKELENKLSALENIVQYLEATLAAVDSAQAMAEFDLKGKLLSANPQFLSALGYSLKALKNKHHQDLLAELPVDYESLWQALCAGETHQGRFLLQDKAGQQQAFHLALSPIMGPEGLPTRILQLATPLTAPSEGGGGQLDEEQVLPLLEAYEIVKKGDLRHSVELAPEHPLHALGEGLNQVLQNFQGALGNIADNAEVMSTSTQALGMAAQEMKNHAEETSDQSNLVSAAAEQVNRNIEVVTTGAEEMTFSIKEIALNANEAAKVATNAVKFANDTSGMMSTLGDSSAQIGKVVKVITSIAQQTNLLALNATIEAARAGEAGKGFAVVANEVKELAKETAKATEDISQKIQAIQADTQNAVKAIGEIQNIITQINDIQNSIASAVEEQAATTGEISHNISEAAKGSKEIAKNIAGVASAAHQSSEGIQETEQATQELGRIAQQIQGLLHEFEF